jgi:hypothetical protein
LLNHFLHSTIHFLSQPIFLLCTTKQREKLFEAVEELSLSILICYYLYFSLLLSEGYQNFVIRPFYFFSFFLLIPLLGHKVTTYQFLNTILYHPKICTKKDRVLTNSFPVTIAQILVKVMRVLCGRSEP